MSDMEYLDLFYNAQKRDCPFRAFLFDVKNSKTIFNQKYNFKKFQKFVNYITQKLLTSKNENDILLDDKDNQIIFVHNIFALDKNFNSIKIFDNNKLNPMIIGDCVCYFINENTISTNEFLKIALDAINKFNIHYSFHFLSGKYETNNYVDGGTKMYKGYMLRILEKLSKTTKYEINKKTILNDETFEEK